MDKQLKSTLTRTGIDVLKALAYIIDLDDTAKRHHSWRVAFLAQQLAKRLSRESMLSVYVAGLLHDIGTFDMSDRLIHHKDHMEDISKPAVRVHPQKSALIAASIPGFTQVAKIILDHHEWYNGEGYPRGISADQISLESQILRIADKVSFIISDHPDCTKSNIYRWLQDRIDREFSSDLYTTLMSVIHHGHTWDTLRDNRQLEQITSSLFSSFTHLKKSRPEETLEILKFFGRVLDAKHSYTQGHSQRVAYYSSLIGLALDLPEHMIMNIKMASYLHDIGKIGIPVHIIDKTGALTADEFQIIQTHASISYNIVKDIPLFQKIAHIVNADQEHWDGSGYPLGLSKTTIPIEARIIFVADAFDAITSNRSYRKAMPVADAIKELERCAGTDFDPDVVSCASLLFCGMEPAAVKTLYSIENEL